MDLKNYETAYAPRLTDVKVGAAPMRSSTAVPMSEINIDDIDEILQAKQQNKAQEEVPRIAEDDAPSVPEFKPGVSYVTSTHLYPEDDFQELKEKIYLFSGIPAYRQHLFYVEHGRIATTYKLTADTIYDIDIRGLAGGQDLVFGLPIDKFLYDNRESIIVNANDTFKLIGDVASPTFYVVDLGYLLKRILTQVVEVLDDAYQFDLLYYGVIIKYWPQMTRECFHDYLNDESELHYKYPDLARPQSIIQANHRAEKQIIDANYRLLVKARSAMHDSMSMSITHMIAAVATPHVMIDIRNLFDRLHVTRCMPEIYAYVEHDGRNYLLRKRHTKNQSDIIFPIIAPMRTGLTIAISLRKADQQSFHEKETSTTTTNEQTRYMFLNIWPNGRYHVRSLWNEEDALDFAEIFTAMKRFVDPLIREISAFGRYVFISGYGLDVMTRDNVIYQSLNISLFWRRSMTADAYKLVRAMLDTYVKARIMLPRNIQQTDRFEIMFRKGMHHFDPTAVERIIAATSGFTITNYYLYLSNPTIKQKWEQHYSGRVMRIQHRTADIKFEVLDIHADEFEIFNSYIMMLAYQANRDPRIDALRAEHKTYENVQKLKKLREQDPELYNLKKYGSDKVYSILCQNARQPLIYTQDEVRAMGPALAKRLIKYWNFTLGKPAHYTCPNDTFPHFGFLASVHPRGYCLPCCNKKSQMTHNSRRAAITSRCLREHIYRDDDVDDVSMSRHVMTYGKDIDIGRFSRMPPLNNMLYGTLPEPQLNYYLYGVAQHLPSAKNIGVLYSLAAALNVSLPDLVKTIICEIKAYEQRGGTSLFTVLSHGVLSDHFTDINEFVRNMREIFVESRQLYKKYKFWPELFVEMARILLGVYVLTFVDNSGKGDAITIHISGTARDEILYIGTSNDIAAAAAPHKFVLILKKHNSVYPVFAIDMEQYHRTKQIRSRTYSYGDQIVSTMYAAIVHNLQTTSIELNKAADLSLIQAFCTHQQRAITLKYINRHNLCYAVLIDNAVYMPIDYSIHTSDGTAISFSVYDGRAIKLSAVLALVAELNKFIAQVHAHRYRAIALTHFVATTKPFGVATSDNYIYYVTEMDQKLDLPTTQINYEFPRVNDAIMNKVAPARDNSSALLGEALYTNYLYRLFLVEFVNHLDHERNSKIRGALRLLIGKTNFRSSLSEFRAELRELVGEWPSDHVMLQSQLFAFYHSHLNKDTLIDSIDNTVYEFDHITANHLRTLPVDAMKAELTQICGKFTLFKNIDTAQLTFPNIYVPCETNESVGYCAGKRLIINRPLAELVDLLAADLGNNLKAKYLLSSTWMQRVIDHFSFEQHPMESVLIYQLNE